MARTVNCVKLGHEAEGMEKPPIKGELGQRVFAADVTIVDDPHRPRGPNSKPFDGEGIANRRRAIIEKGVLTTWVLDLRSARQLGLKSTGHAARGTSSPPSPSLR